MRAPTGEQFTLEFEGESGRSRAIITEVAAGLRVLEVDGVALVDSYPAEAVAPYGAGTILSPWPNRIRDGVWTLDGVSQQLDITEVSNHNAIHGLLHHRPYRVLERTTSSMTLTATVYPQHGYPFVLDTSVRYELVADGIIVTHHFSNASETAAPFAVGAHPFFTVGTVPVEELTLTLSASTHFVLDQRLNPLDEVTVAGTGFDLREGRKVGDLDLDMAFGALARDVDGNALQRLTAPDGQYTQLWQGPDFGYLQAFTPRRFPRWRSGKPDAEGHAVALEPMTAPPDAFNSGKGLRWLAPGEEWTGSWGVTYGRA